MSLTGLALLTYAAVFVYWYSHFDGVDLVVGGFLAVLAAAILYGGHQIGERGRTPLQGLRIFTAMHLFGLTGFVVAALLISYQFLHGVMIVDVWLVSITAGATTGTLGIWLALYYVEHDQRTAELFEHRDRVSNLNKRLTILQRVLRHNLRNEMAIIQGHTETLLEDPGTDAQRRSLEVILEHTQKLESLSDDAHQLRQIWNETATVEVDAVEVARSVVERAAAEHPDVAVEADLPEHAAVVVHPRFSLAVEEAVVNAIQHNDPAEVDVVVAVERLDDETVEVRVSDTGEGTPAFEWETLQQARELPMKHGTGLGLWLIYWIVENSGGELVYESNVPHGTVVRMRVTAATDGGDESVRTDGQAFSDWPGRGS